MTQPVDDDLSEEAAARKQPGENALAEVPHEFLSQSKLKRWLLQSRERACVHAGTIARLTRGMREKNAFGILMYHRVVPSQLRRNPPTWNVSPEQFRRQLLGLIRSGFEPRSLSDVLNVIDRQEALPRNTVVITFDDGYRNNLTHALPILREFAVPATIFLATGYIGTAAPFPFDDWTLKGTADVAPVTWQALTEVECDELLDSGLIEFGSHTHTHEDFRGRPDELAENLELSVEYLRHRFGIELPTLSLPYGCERQGFAGPMFSSAARSAGLTCCLTTEEQLARVDESPFHWGRFIAEQHDSASTLATKLSGWPASIRSKWQQLRGRNN